MYRTNEIYKALEELIKSAGVSIKYVEVPDDSIFGPVWARSNGQCMEIQMPDDPEAFPDDLQACLTLGHEMGHILTELESVDYLADRLINEAVCDIVGSYLYKLAEMIAGENAERQYRQAQKKVQLNTETVQKEPQKMYVNVETIQQDPIVLHLDVEEIKKEPIKMCLEVKKSEPEVKYANVKIIQQEPEDSHTK